MRRSARFRVGAAVATAAVVVTGVLFSMTQAEAQSSGPSGFATENGGTTGGEGGETVQASTGTEIHEALCTRDSESTPIIIEVEGTINHDNTSDVDGDSCDTDDDRIELKGISNITIIGVGDGAVFDQIGIHIRDSSNIILQNLTVKNVKKSGSPTSNGGDAIGMESDVRNVWADHLTLEASGGEDDGYDGLFDMKNNTQYVTLSYSILRDSGRGGLIGSSESDTSNGYVTFHHNLYENIDSRTPLLRGGVSHIYNNHYVGLVKSGINSRAGASAKVDNNYFQDSKDVLGTFYTDELGSWEVNDNIFDNVTWSEEDSENYPAGPDPESNTSVSIPYSYDLDAADCVPDIVSRTAGADTGLQESDGQCSAAQGADGQPVADVLQDQDPTDPPGEDALFAAPDGSDDASGTESDPMTVPAAIEAVEPGGTIYLRDGTYEFSETVYIEPGNDGLEGDRTGLFAYPGEEPVLDFSGQSEDSANRGIAMGGDWWHFYGFVVENSGDNGILLGGNDNIVERVITRHNADTGLQIARYEAGAPEEEWPSNNLVVSSESHDNVDSDGEDADGFAAKLTSGPGNVFRNTVAHNNIDDGWDLYTKDDTGPIGEVTIENSLSYENGTLSDGSQAGDGDRNGFKLGGEDIAVDHTVVDSIAFENGKHGFTYNSNPGSMTITGNVSIGSEERNFNFDGGSSTFTDNTSCDSGDEDRIIGNDAGGNQWWDGENGSRCSDYSGSLDWSFDDEGDLVVTFGGSRVLP